MPSAGMRNIFENHTKLCGFLGWIGSAPLCAFHGELTPAGTGFRRNLLKIVTVHSHFPPRFSALKLRTVLACGTRMCNKSLNRKHLRMFEFSFKIQYTYGILNQKTNYQTCQLSSEVSSENCVHHKLLIWLRANGISWLARFIEIPSVKTFTIKPP